MGIDLFLLGLLLVFTIYGFTKGFIHEICVTLGLILGVWLGLRNSYFINDLLPLIHLPNPWGKIISFIIVLFVILLISTLLGFLLKKLVKAIGLDWLDKILGAVWGLIQGTVIIWVVLLVVLFFRPSAAEILNRSSFSNRILLLSRNIPNFSLELTKIKDRIADFFLQEDNQKKIRKQK